nr:MAG TPA: homing endonuclease [Caudoviricetes sp.]
MKYITPTNSTLKIIVDDEDYNFLNRHKWYISDQGYAITQLRGSKHIRMHHLVAGKCSNKKLVVDHLNRNRLDNRYNNLRWTTQANNAQNRTSIGYCWDDNRKKYVVRYKDKFYGRYDTAKEAERAYQLAKSGVGYQCRNRKYGVLPRHISKQQGKYSVSVQVNNRRSRKVGFNTLKEALTWRNALYERLNIKERED